MLLIWWETTTHFGRVKLSFGLRAYLAGFGVGPANQGVRPRLPSIVALHRLDCSTCLPTKVSLETVLVYISARLHP